MNIARLRNEPLAHFFVIGLLLFVLYGLVNNDSSRSADEIVVNQIRISGLIANFEKTWQRPPTDDEVQNLIDSWVREEVLYREGIAIGFDLDDPDDREIAEGGYGVLHPSTVHAFHGYEEGH